MALIGLPLILATSAAEPAVEPKSIEPALRNSRALLDPSVCTHRILMLSFSNSFSSQPLFLSRMETGLYVAQSILIVSGLSAAKTAVVGSRLTTRTEAKNERRDR